MATFVLVLTMFNLAFETGQNVRTVVVTAKAVHHHSTRPMYRHVLKPIGHAVKQSVAHGGKQ